MAGGRPAGDRGVGVPDYSFFKGSRYGVGIMERDGATYLRNLLRDEPNGETIAESLLARIDRNEPVDVPAEFFAAGIGWPQMIKTLRTIYGVSIPQAQDMALQHSGWLRWVKLRCATDRSCMKQAHFSARNGSLPGWLTLENGKATFIR